MHRWNTRWRESLFSSVVLSLPCLCHTPCTLFSSLLPSISTNQPKHLLFARRRVLASGLSVRGSSACTLCPHSWVNSYAVVVWARPGVLIVTAALYLGQVRFPEMLLFSAPPVLLASLPLSVHHVTVVCMCYCYLGAFTCRHSVFVSCAVDFFPTCSFMFVFDFLYGLS